MYYPQRFRYFMRLCLCSGTELRVRGYYLSRYSAFWGYYSRVLSGVNNRDAQRAQRMVPIAFVILMLGLFLRIVCHGITARCIKGCILHTCERKGTIASLNRRIRTSLGEYDIVRVLSSFFVDLVPGLFALA